MHPIDFGAGIALRLLPQAKRVFTAGWGDPDLLDLLDIATVAPPAPIAVEWGSDRETDGLRERHGRFISPVAHLPQAASDAFVVHLEPPQGSERVCVVLPAWNDEGYATRRKLAGHLAGRGIASLLLEAPLYGARRLLSRGSPIRTVADFALMTRTIVEEGRSLVAWLGAQGRAAGIAGYSMGGSLAATVAATLDIEHAVAPLAAAESPDHVFVHGVLSRSVAWDALGPEARPALAARLALPRVTRRPPSPATRHAVLVAAAYDGFVPRHATEAVHRHWPGSEYRLARAGHATLLWRHMDVLASGVAAAFDRTYGHG